MADYKNGYGKRSLWQWILIYIVIGGIIYAFAYFIFFRGGYKLGASQNSMPHQSRIQQGGQNGY